MMRGGFDGRGYLTIGGVPRIGVTTFGQLEERGMWEPNSGCLLWPNSTNGKGYGQTWFLTGKSYVHRLAWEFTAGPVPAGLQVLHRCDTRCCFNPRHLFLGTDGDNMRDKAEKGRHHCSVKVTCPRGHSYSGENLLPQYGHRINRRCRECKNSSARAARAAAVQAS